jgi:MFS family permease
MMGDRLRKGKFYGWIALAAAGLVLFIVNGSLLFSFGAFLPSICKEFGWKSGDVSVALTILFVVITLSSPLVGFFTGKYGARKAIVLGCLLAALGLLCVAFQSKLWQFRAAYGLIGLGASFGGMITATTIAQNWFVKKAPLAMGITIAAGGIGGFVLVPLIMAMITNVGWRSAYLVLCGIVFLFGAVIPGLFLRNKPEDMGQFPDGAASSEEHGKEAFAAPARTRYVTPVDFTVKEATRTGALWILIIFSNAVFFLLTFLTAHQIAFLTNIGIGAEIAAVTLGLSSGISTVGTLGMGFLALKQSLKMLTAIAASLLLIGIFLALLTRSMPMAFAFSIIFGIGSGAALVAGMSFLASYFGRKDYPKIMGISMLFGIVGSVGAPVGGFLFDATKSYTTAFVVAMVVAAVPLLCMLIIRPPLHPSLKEKGVA